MAEEPKLSRQDWTESIIRRTLGNLKKWEEPNIRDTVGPYFPTVFRGVTEQAQGIVHDLSTAISKLSGEDFLACFETNGAPKSDAARQIVSTNAEKARAWEKTIPIWFSGGFGHPDYVADFEYWSKMARLTLEESVSLTLGVEPKHLPQSLLEKIKKLEDTLAPVPEYLLRRYELLRRRFDPHNFKDNLDPKELAEWINDQKLEVHPDFLGYFYKPPKPIEQLDEVQTGVFTGDKRQLNSISKLIAAMAIDAYGYVPGDARSPIPKEIEDIAARLGLNLGRDTILTYLRIGTKDLPEGWNDQ